MTLSDAIWIGVFVVVMFVVPRLAVWLEERGKEE